ncbi:hypothetical protein [Aquimarina aquimarini]|uniref:hypothetical protein n=1 Tax=Aquimarina aquimarini TaxID=1191734 RepID=UPI000D561ECD|nr:hypothetical protein [Aquimarina aquimarini]
METRKVAFKNFVILKMSKNDKYKNLACDIINDSSLPIDKSFDNLIKYIDFQTMMGGTHEIFGDFLSEFKEYCKNTPVKKIEDIVSYCFTVFNSDKWNKIKDNFCIGTVYLVGNDEDIYKIYCIEEKSKNALKFELKLKVDFNNLIIIDQQRIPKGKLTRKYTVNKAIDILKKCSYQSAIPPNKKSFSEIMLFLELNNR